jgi:hypothetical protein
MSKKQKTDKIRVMVIPPGKPPMVVEVNPTGWTTWYPLIDKTTHLFELRPIAPNLMLLMDEEGRMKNFPLNFLLPGRAPQPMFEPSFIIDLTNGKGMKPGEPGVGYFDILGTVLISRTRGSDHVDLTDKDIETVRGAFNRG